MVKILNAFADKEVNCHLRNEMPTFDIFLRKINLNPVFNNTVFSSLGTRHSILNTVCGLPVRI